MVVDPEQPQINHYRREHAPNVRYIPRDLTIGKMYEDFSEKHPGFCSQEFYRQTLQEMNIFNAMPTVETCEMCEKFQNITEPTEKEVEDYELYHEKLKEARAKYDMDMGTNFPNGVVCYAMDMEKVMLLPRMPKCKEPFFTSRLVVFNQTYAKVGKHDGKSHCIIWNEAIPGWSAEDVACYVH